MYSEDWVETVLDSLEEEGVAKVALKDAGVLHWPPCSSVVLNDDGPLRNRVGRGACYATLNNHYHREPALLLHLPSGDSVLRESFIDWVLSHPMYKDHYIAGNNPEIRKYGLIVKGNDSRTLRMMSTIIFRYLYESGLHSSPLIRRATHLLLEKGMDWAAILPLINHLRESNQLLTVSGYRCQAHCGYPAEGYDLSNWWRKDWSERLSLKSNAERIKRGAMDRRGNVVAPLIGRELKATEAGWHTMLVSGIEAQPSYKKGAVSRWGEKICGLSPEEMADWYYDWWHNTIGSKL